MDDTCAQCGATLRVGRFCLNCGHRIGTPVLTETPSEAATASLTRVEEWDPAEDLLPYDGSYDPSLEDPLGGTTLMGWVIGATLLVSLVFVVLRVINADPTDESVPPASSEPAIQQPEQNADAAPEDRQSPPDPEGVHGIGKPFDAVPAAIVAVPSTTPATTDLDGQLVSYTADKMHDGLPATAWRMAGDGTGSTITITLAEPIVVKRVGLINGYAKQVSGVDWYPNNRRIVSVRWGFEDGSTLEQTFAEEPRLQRARVPSVLTSTITLTITAVTGPGPGELGRDFTAISELAVIGRRAD